jgi:hypothetical protein
MGALPFFRTACGKDPDDAFNNAYYAAASEKGHQNGYSGDLNSKDGFIKAEKPEGVDLLNWVDVLLRRKLPSSLKSHRREFEKQLEISDAKSGPALCFEVADTQDGIKEYFFAGWAPW